MPQCHPDKRRVSSCRTPRGHPKLQALHSVQTPATAGRAPEVTWRAAFMPSLTGGWNTPLFQSSTCVEQMSFAEHTCHQGMNRVPSDMTHNKEASVSSM
mmetsp:Transcript_101638/g.282877  ORF Transcript_101638/g.282877 Transcript_101638/m.282877 type:complete len:99 (-) Transcript_101638:612-908(-)